MKQNTSQHYEHSGHLKFRCSFKEIVASLIILQDKAPITVYGFYLANANIEPFTIEDRSKVPQRDLPYELHRFEKRLVNYAKTFDRFHDHYHSRLECEYASLLKIISPFKVPFQQFLKISNLGLS
jgi:hypothetical protein